MVTVVAVCNPVIFCIDSPSAVSKFADKVATAASKLATQPNKPELVVVFNKCPPEEMKQESPFWFQNLCDSPGMQSVYSKIRRVDVPNFAHGSEPFHAQVRRLRGIIDDRQAAQPLELTLGVVREDVKTTQTAPAAATIDVDQISQNTRTELVADVVRVLEETFSCMVNIGRPYTWPEIETERSQLISKHLTPFQLQKDMEMSVMQTLDMWIRQEFQARCRRCGELCGCEKTSQCKLVINHEGGHRCSTRRYTCAHGCDKILGCEEPGCGHCSTTRSEHSNSLYVLQGSHNRHQFECWYRTKCRDCGKDSTGTAIHCG